MPVTARQTPGGQSRHTVGNFGLHKAAVPALRIYLQLYRRFSAQMGVSTYTLSDGRLDRRRGRRRPAVPGRLFVTISNFDQHLL